jgi:hypothetical protein
MGMSEDQGVIALICVMMSLHAIMNKRKPAFELYKEAEIENKVFLIIEKVLMIVLPFIVLFLNTFFQIHLFVVRLWMILIVLLDFALQYIGRSCGCFYEKKDFKISKLLIVWIVFIVALFFTVKS